MTTPATSTTINTTRKNIDFLSNLLQELSKRQEYKESFRNAKTHESILSKSRETLRVFDTKIPPAQRLCKYDSTEARMVVTLAYVLRHGNMEAGIPTLRVSLDILAKLAGMRKDRIHLMGGAAEHILQSIIAGGSTKSRGHNNGISQPVSLGGVKRRREIERNSKINPTGGEWMPGNGAKRASSSFESISEMAKRTRNNYSFRRNNSHLSNGRDNWTNNHNNNLSNRSVAPILPTQVLPIQYTHNLTMKLQMYLHDPSDVADKCEIFFTELSIHLQDMEKTFTTRKAVLSDLENHHAAYEGACFYFVVKELQDGDKISEKRLNSLSSSSTSSSHISKMNVSAKSILSMKSNSLHGDSMQTIPDEDISSDEENIRLLSIQDIVEALCLDELTFLSILKNVLNPLKHIKKKLSMKTYSMERINANGVTSGAKETDCAKELVLYEQNLNPNNITVINLDVPKTEVGIVKNTDNQFKCSSTNNNNPDIKNKQSFKLSLDFLQWKQKKLLDASMNARKEICEERDISLHQVKKSETLARAANHVLKKLYDLPL